MNEDPTQFAVTSESGQEMKLARQTFGKPAEPRNALYDFIAQNMSNRGMVKLNGPSAGGPSALFAQLIGRSTKRRRQGKRERQAPTGERLDYRSTKPIETVTRDGVQTSLVEVNHVSRTGKNEPGTRFTNYVQYVEGVTDQATRHYGQHPTPAQLRKRGNRVMNSGQPGAFDCAVALYKAADQMEFGL